MKSDCSRSYSSTIFTPLRDAESVARTRKNYFVCITIATAFLCLTVAYFTFKTLIAPEYFTDANINFPTALGVAGPKNRELKLYNPKPLLAAFRRKTSKEDREFSCDESQPQLEAIPEPLIREILEKTFENIGDYLNLDLVLHYEDIINRNGAASLRAIFNEYQMNLLEVKSWRDFLNFLPVLNSNKFKFYVQHMKEENLDHFRSFFAITTELNHWYNYLHRLHELLSTYEQQKGRNYFVNCTTKNFNSFTQDTQKLMFGFSYPFNITDKKLKEVNEVIKEWAKPAEIVFHNSSLVFHGKVLLLSSLNREIRGLNLKSVYFLATRTVFLDEDVDLFGVNLVIIAPNWVHLKKITINLNGVNGENITDGAISGQPGKPGNPGGNAGDFLGIGNADEKFLLVSANGGRGGNGQNGAEGQSGANKTQPGPPVDRPTCLRKGKSFKNAFDQVITHYKIYGETGCGGSGSDGGVAGRGGVGGVVTLVGKKSVKVRKGLNGFAGSPGRGGGGGVGGRDGCFYEALDVDDEFLHRVTRVSCPDGNILPSGESGRDDYNARGQVFPPMKENLNLQKCLLQFIQFFGAEFDSDAISLLKNLNQVYVDNTPDMKDILLEYKLLETFDKIEIYVIFLEKVDKYIRQQPTQPTLYYLRSIILGRMSLLKENINYFFIDLKSYLNILKRGIKATTESTRDLQSGVYLKIKVEVKKEEIKQNLKRITFRLTGGNIRTNCLLMMTAEILQFLLGETSNAKQLESSDVFRSCRLLDWSRKASKQEKKAFWILGNFTNEEDVGGLLQKLKDALYGAKDELSEGERNSLEALTDEVEHFRAVYYFTEWQRLEGLFLKSLQDLALNNSWGEEVAFLKRELVDVLIALQYKSAVDAMKWNFHPFRSKLTRVQFFKNKPSIEEILDQITHLKDDAGRTIFCKNHLKAVFDENSAVGEFYFWPNGKIRSELRELFSGGEIHLKSDLINHHVFDKNFVQFTSLKLEFECNGHRNGCQLDEVLADFKLEMTHSGYSYYNWKGESLIVVGEKVTLEYSFRTGENKQPEIYNVLYKKCQDGDIKLSPFTTWTVRLLPINDDADFSKLLPFSEIANLRLTGSGIYTT